jgi:cytochrome c biogenesis factor
MSDIKSTQKQTNEKALNVATIQNEKYMSKTRQALAEEYGISISTLSKWLIAIKDDLKLQNRAIITPRQLTIIYSEYGNPKEF